MAEPRRLGDGGRRPAPGVGWEAWREYFTDVRREGAKMLVVVGRTDRKSACALLKA